MTAMMVAKFAAGMLIFISFFQIKIFRFILYLSEINVYQKWIKVIFSLQNSY